MWNYEMWLLNNILWFHTNRLWIASPLNIIALSSFQTGLPWGSICTQTVLQFEQGLICLDIIAATAESVFPIFSWRHPEFSICLVRLEIHQFLWFLWLRLVQFHWLMAFLKLSIWVHIPSIMHVSKSIYILTATGSWIGLILPR